MEVYVATNEEPRFSELVSSEFSADEEGARVLWVPLGQQFNGDGPDAVRAYLDAEREKLVRHVKKLLGQVEERIDQ